MPSDWYENLSRKKCPVKVDWPMKAGFRTSGDLFGVMNDTKWEELRLAMYGLADQSPQFQVMDVERGHLSAWDGDWYHHFRLPVESYSKIEWCDLRVRSESHRHAVLEALVAIHLPGKHTTERFRIYGWVRSGEHVSYIE